MAPIHNLNQWWLTTQWTLTNKLQWNADQNPYILFLGCALENPTFEMSVIFLMSKHVIIMLPISHSQYHGCWWPGDASSQGINSNDIDLFHLRWLGPHPLRVKWTHRNKSQWIFNQNTKLFIQGNMFLKTVSAKHSGLKFCSGLNLLRHGCKHFQWYPRCAKTGRLPHSGHKRKI